MRHLDFVALDLDFVAAGLDFVAPGFDFVAPGFESDLAASASSATAERIDSSRDDIHIASRNHPDGW
jgi:hypothetical protein